MNFKKFIRLFGINLNPKDFYYEDLNSRYGDLSGYGSILKLIEISPFVCSDTAYVDVSGEFPKLKSIKNNHHTFTEYAHEDIKNLKIFLFRDLIGGLKVRKEMHFLGNELFLLKYSFPYISLLQKESLRSKALVKYLQHDETLFENIQIKCPDNYSVFINDSVEFEIYHINNNSAFFKILEKYLATKLSGKERLTAKESEIPEYI